MNDFNTNSIYLNINLNMVRNSGSSPTPSTSGKLTFIVSNTPY